MLFPLRPPLRPFGVQRYRHGYRGSRHFVPPPPVNLAAPLRGAMTTCVSWRRGGVSLCFRIDGGCGGYVSCSSIKLRLELFPPRPPLRPFGVQHYRHGYRGSRHFVPPPPVNLAAPLRGAMPTCVSWRERWRVPVLSDGYWLQVVRFSVLSD